MTVQDYSYPWYGKLLHLGMAGFGITAYLTGELAEGGANSTGYWLHAYLGLSLACFVLMRIIRGVVGPGPLRFSGWSPFSRRQWILAAQDLGSLIRFRIPERGMHEGLAGLTQALGILIFALMGATGTVLLLPSGGAESGLFEAMEEIHEAGEALIPAYLVLHAGAALLHLLAGHPNWRRMWTIGSRPLHRQVNDLT